MFKKYTFIVSILVLSALVLSACNLSDRQTLEGQIPSIQAIQATNTPTPVPSLCDNLYFPNSVGDSWEYTGNTSATGAYSRTDSVASASEDAFTVQSNTSGVSYNVDFSCSPAGLLAVNPIQQYLGAILTNLQGQVELNLTSNSGISLPKTIHPGDTWQQVVEWEGSAQGYSTTGNLVIDYSAVGFETVTTSSGTYDALRVNISIRIEVSPLRIQYGTYEITTWMAPNVGIVKSQGSSNIPNVQFSDSLDLTSFTAAP